MVKILDNRQLEAETKAVKNESIIGQEFVGIGMIPDGSEYIDVTYITRIRMFKDGRPTQMLQSFSKVSNNEYVKKKRQNKVIETVNEGEVEL